MKLSVCKTTTCLSIALLVTLSLSVTQPTKADGGKISSPAHAKHGTLFQWSSDVSGGADLSSPLITDRPDFTESTVTVGQGITQIEFGYTYIHSGDSDVYSLGEPLLRYGILAEWLELRLGIFPLEADGEPGFSDLYFGFKIALTPQDGLLPEMALIPQTFAPTGSDVFTDGGWQPGLNWTYGWQVNDLLSTAGSTQINRRFTDSDDDFLRLAQSWTVSLSLSEKAGVYTEWFAFFPVDSGAAENEHYLNGGLTYLINNDMQFDVRVGWGLNEAAEDFFAGAGLSVRFQ